MFQLCREILSFFQISDLIYIVIKNIKIKLESLLNIKSFYLLNI